MSILSRTPPRRDSWITTRWSVVSRLDDREETTWEASWEWLVQTYRPTMERYARRVLSRITGRPISADEASEVVQDFLVTCVEKQWLSNADQHKGRFRAYIQMLLKRYCFGHLRHASARKRSPGPDRKTYSIFDDDAADEMTAEDQAEIEEFDRSWVRIAVDRTLKRMRRENDRYLTVVVDLIETDGEGSPDLAERVKTHRSQFPVLKHRVRTRFNKIFEEELAQTVGSQEAFEEEWRALAPYVARHRTKEA